MGKYMRKGKLTGDVVAIMDVSQSSLGVRTRATTLALQKLQALRSTAAPPPEQHRELSYLQLRSRKLEKPLLKQSTCHRQQNPNPSSLAIRSCGSVSAGSGSNNGDASALGGLQIKAEGETEAHCDFGTEETSFGENNVEFDGRESGHMVSFIINWHLFHTKTASVNRSTRESTPCSFIRDSNDSFTPGSGTRHTIVPNSIQRIMPCAQEIDGFFARHAQEQQRLFSEKYNFDISNEKPLQGRYEWVRVQP